jgi:hypothetical protein
MRRFRRSATGLIAAGALLACASGCGAPAFTYATDQSDQVFFKVPSAWHEIPPVDLADAQSVLLSKSPLGAFGGSYTWSRAYSEADRLTLGTIFTASTEPVVYVSVENLNSTLRSEMSYDLMRDVLFPVTPTARQEAKAEGDKLTGFDQISSTTFTNQYDMRGINELYEYTIDGQPDTFDVTALTNVATDKLYVMLVQCYQTCFLANQKQIATVINSFLVRGSS